MTSTANQHAHGPFAIAKKTRAGNLRRVPDTKFDSYEAALSYGLKYHTGRCGERQFEVVQHPDGVEQVVARHCDDQGYRQSGR